MFVCVCVDTMYKIESSLQFAPVFKSLSIYIYMVSMRRVR